MLEMELKFRVESFREIEEKLEELGVQLSGPSNEKNMILDRMGSPLRKEDTLFRLRNCPKGTLVTVKKPLPATALKVRREREAVLDCNLEDALKLFRLLGYDVTYEYEKTRSQCRLKDATVCLDRLWFGSYVEVEAQSEDALEEALEMLGLDSKEGIRFSYPALETQAEEGI